MKITVPSHVIKALAACMASNDVRYYLNGICLCPINKRLSLVATDGHQATAYELIDSFLSKRFGGLEVEVPPTGAINEIIEGNKFVIPAGAVTVALTLAKGKGSEISIIGESDGGNIGFAVGGIVVPINLIEGKFPDVWRVMTAKPAIAPTAFDAAKVKRCIAAIEQFYGSTAIKGVFIEPNGENAMRLIALEGRVSMRLMPMRDTLDGNSDFVMHKT